jgi:uncharacterized SAM-binding protein YcdF (DUF218 family)
MNWRSPHVTVVVLVLLPLTFYGLWGVLWTAFGHVLNHHAWRADSPYFLPACVACAITPWVGGGLYACYWALHLRMRRRAEREADEASDTECGRHDG